MLNNLMEALIFFLFAGLIVISVGLVILSVFLLIRWIRAYFNKQSKPYRIRIGIALLVLSIIFLIFVCTELLPNMYWPL